MPATARRTPRPDDGFSLVEVIVALAVVTVVLTAGAVFLVKGMTTTEAQRTRQAAARIAGDAIETVSGLSGTGLRTGRDQTRTAAQWANPPAGVAAYLSGATASYDDTATTASTPRLPFADEQVADGITYRRTILLGQCRRTAATLSSACTTTTGTGTVPFYRVVVAVTWTDRDCPATGCLYVTTTLVGVTVDDPVFSDTPQAVTLAITSPGNRSDAAGQRVAVRLRSAGGVAPVTWAYTGLPAGVTGSSGGVITGRPTAAGTNPVTVTATDAAGRTATATVTWTVTA